MSSSFTDLSPKVVELIFGFLDKKDRKRLGLVNKAIYKIFQQYEKLNTVELNVTMKKNNFKQMDENLKRYPNLKRLHFSFRDATSPQWNLAEFREFVDNWSTQLDEIEVSISCWDSEHLLKAFEEWNNEKLTFGHIQLVLARGNMESIKWFFSHPRRIKHLEAFGTIQVLDKALFDIINRNATIERLEVPYKNIRSNSIPKVFFNVNGVKEIDLHLNRSPVDSGNFTPEALLKVTQFTDQEISESDIWPQRKFTDMPHFQNLRKLHLWHKIIVDDDIKFMVENFPNLEEIFIRDFRAYGGTIFSGLQSLKKIELWQATLLSDENLIVGFNLPNLTRLSIKSVGNVTLTGAKRFIANCPKLEQLAFQGALEESCFAYIKENFIWPEPLYYSYKVWYKD